MEEESVRKQLGAKGLKVDRKSGKVVPELKVHELRAETYNGMVRLLKPGCRTIVLIVDKESKEKLVPKFYKLAWPYRRNKTLMFGFLYIEKGMIFYFYKNLVLSLRNSELCNLEYLTGILLKMGAYGAKGLTPINFKTMYYEVTL